jgi:hypothetical protein
MPSLEDAATKATVRCGSRWCVGAATAIVRELFIDIGLGRKIASIVAKRLARLLVERGQRPDALTLTMGRFAPESDVPTQGMVIVDGSENATLQLATCCRPIPGDAIVGYLGRGEGLTVHTAECSVGKRLFERDADRWIGVDWSEHPIRVFQTAVEVLVRNGKGVLAQVAAAVSAAEADIAHVDMDSAPRRCHLRAAPAAGGARPPAPGRRAACGAPRSVGHEGRPAEGLAPARPARLQLARNSTRDASTRVRSVDKTARTRTSRSLARSTSVPLSYRGPGDVP